MCGIIGYTKKNSEDKLTTGKILSDGLKNLEYRGYDSCGIAVLKKTNNNNDIVLKKGVGKVREVCEKLDFNYIDGVLGIGHTRWATHGKVDKTNSHPHLDCIKNIAIVHNGIIENFQKLKENLVNLGHKFSSETDSEIIAHLIEEHLKKGKSFKESFRLAIQELNGRYAILAIKKDEKIILGAKFGSPLIVASNEAGNFLISDLSAVENYSNKIAHLQDGQLIEINDLTIEVTDLQKNKVDIIWSFRNIQKNEENNLKFKHQLLQEINEQEYTIIKTIESNVKQSREFAEQIIKSRQVIFIGCGSAANVSFLASVLFTKIAKINASYCIASEFESKLPVLNEKDLIIAISQSGETADTMEAIDSAKKIGCKTYSIVNTEESSITRKTEKTILLRIGPEKAVCSTKAVTAQIAIIYQIANYLIDNEEFNEQIQNAIKNNSFIFQPDFSQTISMLAKKIVDKKNIFIIGTAEQMPIALECALKLQEVAVVDAFGFASGELKHGPLALIEKNTPIIALFNNDDTDKFVQSNAIEAKTRGAYIIAINAKDDSEFDFKIKFNQAFGFNTILNLIIIQLLSYHIGVEKKLDVDLIRNLAKSVTVK